MAKSRTEKGEVLAKLKEIFTTSPSIAFVNFHKLTVKQVEALRRAMTSAGSGYLVAKKTFIAKSLEGAKVAGTAPELPGEIAVAYLKSGRDATAPAREVFGFEKKFEKAVQLVGGIFEGLFKGREEMLAIASIPPRETLLAQFVNLVNSPIQRLVVGLSEVAKKKSY